MDIGWVILDHLKKKLALEIAMKEPNRSIDYTIDRPDSVNRPAHYNQGEIECIDAIRVALGHEGFVAYCRGNAIEYNWRAGLKLDEQEDLKKAAWYSNMAAGDDPRELKIKPDPTVLSEVLDQTKENWSDMIVPPECDTRSPRERQKERQMAAGLSQRCLSCGAVPGRGHQAGCTEL